MALLVQVCSEKAGAAFGGAVVLVPMLPTEEGPTLDNRHRVTEALGVIGEAVGRGELDDLLTAEAASA